MNSENTGDKLPPNVIRVARLPERKKSGGSSTMRLLATFCYYFPAYTLKEARKVPYKHIVLMLNQAKRLQSANYYELLQISVAPHTQKGEGVKTLNERFSNEMNS